MNGAPDDACSIYFTSQTLNETQDLKQIVKSTVSSGFKLFGLFDFSTNQEFNHISQTIENGYYKFIFSNADCRFYTTTLRTENLPSFSGEMLTWLDKLNASFSTAYPRSSILYDFIDYFGTHYPVKVSYGASYTIIYRIIESSYESFVKTTKNINTVASLFSIINFKNQKLDTKTKLQINRFQSIAETRTKAIGPSPPAVIDTRSWLETIRQSPAPIKYHLDPINNLFTFNIMDLYMSKLAIDNIQEALLYVEKNYCHHLSTRGALEQC